MAFKVIPAIDLRAGRCVRLEQGDYARETVFADDPAAAALRWVNAGARRVHIVDLDGARAGRQTNRRAIAAIVAAVRGLPGGQDITLDLGGGLRTMTDLVAVLESGIDVAVLGTAAVTRPDLVARAAERFPGRIAVGIDTRDGRVAVRGWTETMPMDALELARRVAAAGASEIIATDIVRDGTLTEPNLPFVEALVQAVAVPVIASGGVARPEHVAQLAAVGVAGVIVGRALYTGDVTLEAARAAVAAGAR